LSSNQVSLQTKLALLKVLPEIVRESVRPLEAIDSIKIVQVDGITPRGPSQAGNGGVSNGSGNLAHDAVTAALAYRAQAPMIDGLMKELGLSGASLESLVEGVAAVKAHAEPAGEAN
ncbi:MAG: flotillin domain-containing protein, partial [Methylocystis silviterrae]